MTRTAQVSRDTKETSIRVKVDLDGTGAATVETPIGFLTHMVEQLARHGLVDLEVVAKGDTHIDGHHTTEDLALALGQAVGQSLGDKHGISRYGWAMLPMDEACVQACIDFSGRPHLVWRVDLDKGTIGEFDTELAEVFFDGFVRGAACNLHVRCLEGRNSHHIVELCFKTFARALRHAVSIDPRVQGVPSTKGTLKD